MNNRYFWRRSFAYAIDLLIVGVFVAVVALVLNGIFSVKVLAPALIKSTICEARDNLITPERMNELLPLEQGQDHQQILCQQTNMLTTTFYTTVLRKVWTKGDVNYNINISYFSDENGKQSAYIPSEPFFHLLAPFIFALFLARWGQTPGKRLLNLTVHNDALETPDTKSALKREYLKAVIFVFIALYGLYTTYIATNFDINETALLVQSMSLEQEQSDIWKWLALSFVIFAAAFWFQFGSFIRWRGRTYWDQFTKLNTGLIEQLQRSKSLKE